MDLFVQRNGSDDVLNTGIFDIEIRRGTHDLNDVLLAAVKSQSAGVESTHFLSALGKLVGGQTQRDLFQIGVTPAQWESGLAECVEEKASGLPPERLVRSSLHPSALATLEKAAAICDEYKLVRISEPVLLLSALCHLTPSARGLFSSAEIDLEAWCTKLEEIIRPIEKLELYLTEQTAAPLNLDVFSPSGRKVLDLMRSEAEAMGYEVCDPRHLLLGLVLREGGAMQYGLHHQGILPKKVQEAVTLSLLARAKRTRSSLVLDQGHIQPIARQILDASADVASRAHLKQIAETHLLRGFLAVESLARRILEDEGVKLHPLLEIAENYEIGEEVEDKDTIADVESVRQNLKGRLVGQDDAVERILPYIQRMRFGFSVPGKPIGVFLFCGQSGSGKTEMAKELARSVYGSEENLIFLEMGQFNAPESMNIFVGAPPGYIGYGEGKLTNGLRDKPRSVVLFDEVEKAHARVLDALLRFLDEGKIDDPAGPVRDGSECILILTSNVGAEQLSQLWKEVENNPNWRTEIRKRLREEFKKHNFRIEFLNRVDELILFRTLTSDDYAEIARRQLKRHLSRLEKEKQIKIDVDGAVLEAIGKYCENINEGARPVLRLVNGAIISKSVDYVLMNHLPLPAQVKVILGGLGMDDEELPEDAEPVTAVITA
jgi:ATP-dependent Clp protease ATP-binding subunit ClpA